MFNLALQFVFLHIFTKYNTYKRQQFCYTGFHFILFNINSVILEIFNISYNDISSKINNSNFFKAAQFTVWP